MPLLSAGFQVNFRNWFPSITKKQIKDMFDAAGILLGSPPSPPESGERRQLAMTYLGGINWESAADTRKILDAVSIALEMKSILPADREALRALCVEEGLRFEGKKVVLASRSASGIKNLIFAANGPKPELVLIDAMSNEIQITKNAEFCLVYDRPIGPDGLLWSELVAWWKESARPNKNSTTPAGIELNARLQEGLNEPEKLLMRRYSATMKPKLGDRYPAIIPQVHMDYDPYTKFQRQEPGPLERQRMDFLLLLEGGRRVVLEIDGKQHYSDADRPSPLKYAKMVAEDRRLKLRGYQVFRFGGQEFVDVSNAEAMLDAFFIDLFTACGYTLD
jgi:very-short-patch-repair endonuclease